MITKKLALLFALPFFWLSGAAEGAMNDYCVTPLQSVSSTKPNILLLMDYSGSMQFPAYVTCSYDSHNTYDGVVVNCQTPNSSSSDNYDSATTYYGYFDTSKYYRYGSSKFQVNASCSDIDKIGSSNSCISGNLLNWITSTRIDVSRKVLTGGRTNTGASDTYQSEGARIVYTDTGTHCKFTITTTSTNGAGAAKSRTIQIANQSASHTCPLGTLGASQIDIAPVDPSADTGIIQDFYNKATFEFMIFNSDNTGELLSAKDATESSLIAAISNEAPYNGTPTGEGLLEAQDYFKQSDDHNYEHNTSDLSLGNGVKDPWYDGSGAGSKKIPCRKCFTLLISDGAWNGSKDPVTPARIMRTTDQRGDLTGTQRVTTYVVYAFGDKDPDVRLQGRQAMITTAIFGGFDDNDSNGYPYPFTSDPASLTVTYPLSHCNPSATWDTSCKEWDKNRSGLPYNYFEADDGRALETSLTSALNDILRKASSGTAASVLASSEGSGANILQSVFYPTRMFDDTEIAWTGEMQNLWYYIDPYLANASIREDTDSNKTLNLTQDYKIEFFYDTTDSKTKVNRYSTNADGSGKTFVDVVPFEDIRNIWEVGTQLFQRNLTTSPRTIYTSTDASHLSAFSTANSTTLRPYLQAADVTEATKIINYVHGTDQTGCRSRTVSVSGTPGVWKLGDIVSSTPKIQSAMPPNSYDKPAPDGYSDMTYADYISTASYQNRGMAYVGGNDGMLHAFKFGKLVELTSGNDKASLTNPDASTGLGSEAWSFIPKNALPYLKYLTDPNYCHVNLIDLPPFIVDASAPTGVGADTSTATKTSSSWKTILIGGMALGGASKITTDSCTLGASGTCVKTPTTDPSDSAKGLGYSSYFALNVTDPANPQLLWEFSNPALGFSTSGPAIIRVGDPNKNGQWFAIFASGPTGPIDTINHQFLGKSDQNLKLFVVDLYTGSLVKTIDTSLANAFGGSLVYSTIDVDRGGTGNGLYKDDAFYLGYTQKDTASSTWTKGGVLRVITKEDPDPNNWSVSTVINGVGPVTNSIAKLRDRRSRSLWLFFGAGRFYYKYDSTVDDALGKRALYGLMEPCYTSSNTLNTACTTTIVTSDLLDQSGDLPSTTLTANARGWYINLGPATKGDGTTEATTEAEAANGAERVITDPLALFSGLVYFTTYVPSTDVCSGGGNTYIWLVKYNVGNSPNTPHGKALTQVSTGTIQELDLSSVFTQRGNRRSAAITGMPPRGQGLSILTNPRPTKKFLHIREK